MSQKVGTHLVGADMGSGPCSKGSALSSNQPNEAEKTDTVQGDDK